MSLVPNKPFEFLDRNGRRLVKKTITSKRLRSCWDNVLLKLITAKPQQLSVTGNETTLGAIYAMELEETTIQ